MAFQVFFKNYSDISMELSFIFYPIVIFFPVIFLLNLNELLLLPSAGKINNNVIIV